jgi:dTDP-4-amino-4,6-dideoxygalactose transaminase
MKRLRLVLSIFMRVYHSLKVVLLGKSRCFMRTLNLPSSTKLSEEDVKYIAQRIRESLMEAGG